ncbi:hypothetical protein CUMW_258070, partial [Citrus unshiu]
MIDGSKVLQSIGSLLSLKTLYLSYTNFKGTVVNQELHNFTNLEELILDESNLQLMPLEWLTLSNSMKMSILKNPHIRGCLH